MEDSRDDVGRRPSDLTHRLVARWKQILRLFHRRPGSHPVRRSAKSPIETVVIGFLGCRRAPIWAETPPLEQIRLAVQEGEGGDQQEQDIARRSRPTTPIPLPTVG